MILWLLLGDVVSLEIQRREPFAGGSYEKIAGVVKFAVDPARNPTIVDLELAPRNAQGLVEFESEFFILAPKKGNGAMLFEANNRGLKLAIRAFNGGPGGNDPSTEADAGDGFLFRRGYAIVWLGWIGEILPGDGRMLFRAPTVPRTGVVRYETITNVPAESLPLARREGLASYSPVKDGVLTWRMRETDPRVEIPRAQWSLERQGGAIRLRVAGGFRPGYIYELVSEAEGPIVQGLGFAAVRDFASFLRYDATDRNPLKNSINRTHAFGISQAGRFLKSLVFYDFNTDESGRRVFDGLMPHVAGAGLGSFNHRFAQPTRFNGQHEEHLYPCDMFPFTYGDEVDPFSGRTNGIQKKCRNLPRIMHTQNASEYWHRSGSLVHTDPKGLLDADIPENVRIYAIGGTQHGRTRDPALAKGVDNPVNPLDVQPFLKALLDALDAWVRDGTPPPPSVYPRIDRGTLVGWDQKSTGFPSLPGVRYPQVIQRPHALDFGPEFESRGIISIEPPRILGDYVVKVPRCDADGNDLGTLLLPEVAVPLGTFTGWNLRGREIGAEGMLAELLGSYIAFPRASLQEHYGNFDEYRRRFAAACEKLVAERFLLREDAERLVRSRDEVKSLFEK